MLAPAAATAAPSGPHRSGRDGARAYWTPKRMANATALPVPTATPDELRAAAPLAAGRPGSIAPSPPAGVATDRSGVDRAATGEVPDQTTYPQSANGRMFFRSGNSTYVCSASVVQSATSSVIVTAGHCIYDRRDGFSSKIVFVPAYRSNSRPFGAWSWKYEIVAKQWFRSRSSGYDYGAIKLKPNSRGRVGDVVGEEGIAWNYPRNQSYRVIGYPSNHANGEVMWGCDGNFLGTDDGPWSGPATTAVDCDFGPGSSGGGWSFYKGVGDGPYVGSVTSYGYTDEPNVLYGPYFDRTIQDLVKNANRH